MSHSRVGRTGTGRGVGGSALEAGGGGALQKPPRGTHNAASPPHPAPPIQSVKIQAGCVQRSRGKHLD